MSPSPSAREQLGVLVLCSGFPFCAPQTYLSSIFFTSSSSSSTLSSSSLSFSSSSSSLPAGCSLTWELSSSPEAFEVPQPSS